MLSNATRKREPSAPVMFSLLSVYHAALGNIKAQFPPYKLFRSLFRSWLLRLQVDLAALTPARPTSSLGLEQRQSPTKTKCKRLNPGHTGHVTTLTPSSSDPCINIAAGATTATQARSATAVGVTAASASGLRPWIRHRVDMASGAYKRTLGKYINFGAGPC